MKASDLTAGQRLALDGFLVVARAEIGVVEVPGDGDNPRIQEYQRTTTRSPLWVRDKIAWCSSFANWVTLQGRITGTGSAAARSWLRWGEPVDELVPGCLVVFGRPPLPGSGHVAFYDPAGPSSAGVDVVAKPGQLIVLGGNQRDRVCWQARQHTGLRGVLKGGLRVPRVLDLPEELRA